MKEISQELKKPHFGLHLTFDGYQCSAAVLNDRQKIERYFNDLVRQLKMKIIFGPEVLHAEANAKKDPGGYSGFVMIQESHISAHTFPKRRFISIDAYSCTDFDYKKALAFTKKFFKAGSVEINVIVRGKRYPMRNIV